MKQFLLFALIVLPSFLLAQPTLTFSPIHNATNVSTTGDLTITSNEGLKTTTGVNLDSDNVDGLISLLDENLDPVSFAADISTNRQVITINPSSDLKELHEYTLIFQPVEGNSGAETSVQTIVFTTGDFTDPVFNLARAINNKGDEFTFKVNVSEGATVFYVVDIDNSTPSVTEIRNGQKNGGSPAEKSGSFTVTANTDKEVPITGLDFVTPVKFNIYFFAEDNASPKNETNVISRGIPLLNSSSVLAPGPDQLDLTVNVDEAVTTYYVVTQSSVQPTSAQILNAQDASGGSPDASGSFGVAASIDTDHSITGLDDLTTYHVHFVSIDGSGNQTIVESKSAMTTDGTGPVVVTLNPSDNSALIDISTNTFTITFDENVSISNASGVGNEVLVRLFENGAMVEDIDRNDMTVGTDGAIITDGTPNVSITFAYDLLPNRSYYILIGSKVFQDASQNNFGGLSASTDWNFSTSGVTTNNAISNICSGSFQSIGNIEISETGVADFNNGAGQKLILSLENSSEFIFLNTGVTVSGLTADVTSLNVSVGLTSLTITYTVAGGTVLDRFTISGLKVYATGAATPTTIRRSGGNADQDGNNGTGASSLTYATIAVGVTSPSVPVLETSPAQDLTFCQNQDITSATIAVENGSGTFTWYDDASLSTPLATGYQVNIADLDINSAVIGAVKRYVVHVDGCQSNPLEVTFNVGPNPVADAGPDKTVCTGTALTLGGNPTLAVPSAPGAYTYSWAYVEDTPEPAAVANPLYTVTNSSTTSNALYTFEVTITDANGCTGTDVTTIEVKATFDISLISPTSLTFTPNSPNLTLAASPAGGVFSGVGIIQSNAPSTYQFSPATAHATDPNTLPKNFQIYYTVTQDGCTQTDYPIASFTISNSFFSTLQPEYCANEYPNPSLGVTLSLDVAGYTSVDNRKNSWNNGERFTRGPYNTPWQAGIHTYSYNSYVRYNNEIYRCNNPLGCSAGLGAPDAGGSWIYENILKVAFNGLIANYYEGYYGGNKSGSTIVKDGTTYPVGGKTFNHYRFGTNVNYNDCPTCDFAWPATYLEFERPEDIRLMLPSWAPTHYFYQGDLVSYLGNVYKCLVPWTTNSIPQPDNSNLAWQNVTNLDYGNGQYFHKRDTPGGPFRSGFYVSGQYVQINRNPTVFFSGLADGQNVCEFDILNLDNTASSTGITYNLAGNFSNQNPTQAFSVKLEGAGTFDLGGGTIVNNILKPGTATFDTRNAFINSTGGGSSLKQVEIQYEVNPGTNGSSGQPCYGRSSIVVDVLQNSTFDFDNVVDPEGSVYCYTEAAKELRSVTGTTVINGTAGAPNSVVYSGFGVNDLGNSLGTFRPGVAIDQISPSTTVQQSVPVTAVYRDANQCRSTRVRNFKVNPDIDPSFTFGGRVNYCYEDLANSFAGHVEDFTANSTTITSAGAYDFVFRDPGNNEHRLQTVNSNNASFTAKTFYDQIQNILTAGGYTGDINQTANVNVIYTETLSAGAVCRESFTQAMIINPPITLDIFGLNDGDILCRNDNANVSQGSLVSFDGSVTGLGIFSLDDDTDFTSINSTLNSTVNTVSGKASINLLSAYNAASDPSDPRQVFLQYRYTGPGCTGPASVFKGFHISPPPPVAFDFTAGNSPANGEIFCNDEVTVQLKTVQNTNVTISGYGITDPGTGNGVAIFNPGLAFNTSVSNGGSLNSKQNINVTARILDGVGCANISSITYIVNPIPQSQVNFDAKEFCYEDAPGFIRGQQFKSWYSIEYLGGTTPYTENIGSINSPQSQVEFSPKSRFDHAITLGASALTPVNFNVYYYVADADNCTISTGPTLVSVANKIDVTIAGLDNNDIFCSNETKGEKALTFTPYPADASKREFSINGETQSITSDKYTFRPPLHGGDFLLEYVVFSGESNCSNTDAASVKVLPSPKAIFTPVPACDGDLIDFNADGTSNLSSAIYTWTLLDVIKSGQHVQHQFQGTNLFGVKLKVEYPAYNNDPTLVCQDSLRLDQVVGAIPQELDFKYFNVCESDQTSFGIQSDIPVSKVSWDFGDGAVTPLGFSAEQVQAVNNTSGTYQSPVHTFPGAGNYDVIVTGKTADIFGGCERTEVHSIAILNNWSPSPAEPFYDMSRINGGNGYWVKEDPVGNSTWDFNIARKKHIITNESAWVTGAVNPYKPDDVSYVNSPCFDLSSYTRPVLSIQHWTDTDPSDGAVVQYSIDGGETWKRLGNVASGLSWYNKLTIQSNPGEQPDLTSGWSESNQRAWATGKHTLDGIDLPRNQVRFRVAFSSFKNREGRDGFAFNNVVIEERNRTILVENFTQLDRSANNDGFKEFKGVFNPNELVKLQYHHAPATPGATLDKLHLDNPVDQNARAAFYGVTNPVRAFIDGGFGQLSASAAFPSLALDNYFDLRSLVTSPVNISIDFLPESDPAQLNVKATVRATSDIGNPGDYNVFIAIAEQSVMGQQYVLRKFLPNAAGTPLTSLSESDPAQEIIASYDMRHVTRLPNGEFAPFAVIVFVQHLETKDVLQTTMRQDGTASSEIVTGLEISFDNYIRVYPNPADDIMNVILPSPVKEHTPVKLFDSFGRQVYAGTFNQGEHLKTLDTKPLPTGVYLIQISTDRGLVQKKVMIVHE